MGNSKSIAALQVVKNSKQPDLWKVIQNIGHCDLVTNIETGQQAESYTVPLDGRIKLQKQYEIYQYRRTQNENLIKVYQVIKKDSEYLCSGIDFLNIKTQRILYRLNQIKQLMLPQIVYTIYAVLTGCQRIKQLNGPVKIDGNMIGITQNGEIKVWLNQNIAKNHPQLEYQFDPYVSIEQSQKQMIQQIIASVKLQTKNQLFPQKIRQRFNGNSIQTFESALEVIKQIAHSLGINLDNIRINLKSNMNLRQNQQTIQNSNVPVINHQINTNNHQISPILPTNQQSYDIIISQEKHQSDQNKNKITTTDGSIIRQSSNSSLVNSKINNQSYLEPQITIKPYSQHSPQIFSFTTYNHTKIPENYTLQNTQKPITNPVLLNSKGKPSRPISSKGTVDYVLQSMYDSKRSASRQNSKNKSANKTNIQTLSPSQKPLSIHSNSPKSLSNSKKSSKSFQPLVKSQYTSQEKLTIKSYNSPFNNNQLANKGQKSFAFSPSIFPYGSSIVERSPITNRFQKQQQFVKKYSVEKLNPPSSNSPFSITSTTPTSNYFFQHNTRMQQPSFAPLSKPMSASKPYESIEKGIAILKQRIDFDQYKS